MTRLLILPLLLALMLVAGCNDLGNTNGKGYIAQDGAVTEIAPGQRGNPISLSGQGLDGEPIDLSSYRGTPVVVNVWGSWCDPCIAEAPDLAAVAASAPVPFLGIDIRDDVASAKAFNRSMGITYPSIFDEGSTTLLAFRDYPVLSPPTTYVLDDQGRVAAVVAGELPSQQTLADVIDRVASDG